MYFRPCVDKPKPIVIEIGKPQQWSHAITTRFRLHGFEFKLMSGAKVSSEPFHCHGETFVLEADATDCDDVKLLLRRCDENGTNKPFLLEVKVSTRRLPSILFLKIKSTVMKFMEATGSVRCNNFRTEKNALLKRLKRFGAIDADGSVQLDVTIRVNK